MISELAQVLATTPWLLAGGTFVLSLIVGSFLNVVIHRLPIMLDREWKTQAREILADGEAGAAVATGHAERFNLLVPRSRCPHCNVVIRAWQNVPVASWLLLGGKCANCGARISLRYPLVELATAVLSTAVALHFGWHWQTVAALVLTWALVALTVIDLDHKLLPDAITVPLMWLGLLASLAWQPGLRPPAPVDPHSALLGAAAGYLVLWTVYWLFKLATGREGMGYGDFKLLAALGAWLGWQLLPLVLLLSAFAGVVVGGTWILLGRRGRHVEFPFGPYLAIAGWIALMWGPQIVSGYVERLLGG